MLDNYLVSKLFRLKQPPSESDNERPGGKPSKKATHLKPRICYNPKEFLRDLIPSCCRCCKCCKPNRLERGFEKARDLLEDEVNIVEIIKSRRQIKAALRLLLTREQRIALRKHNTYIEVDPDAEESKDKASKGQSDDQSSGYFTSDGETDPDHHGPTIDSARRTAAGLELAPATFITSNEVSHVKNESIKGLLG